MDNKITGSITALLDYAIKSGKDTLRLFEVDEQDAALYQAGIVEAFDGDTTNMRFEYQGRMVEVSVDEEHCLIAKITNTPKPTKRNLEEYKQWWKENNPYMLDEAPKPKSFDKETFW